jgi:phosphoribosylglycinamide formyltransferase 1
MKKIAILASGSGSNAENIIKYFKKKKHAQVEIILCNKEDAFVFERAKRLNIEAQYLSNSEFKAGDKLLEILIAKQIDLVVLAGFLLKIPENLLDQYPDKIVNIHPALLPKYGGKGMYGMNVHKAVVENKESVTGITIHLVNENYDEGQILFQSSVSVSPNDDAEKVAHKIHNLEYMHFPRVIDEIIKKTS